MSDLTFGEKRKFEQLLGMEGGYVLGFSNRTFADFIFDTTGKKIYDSFYAYGSGSKANRLRAFWLKEDNSLVGKLMQEMLSICADERDSKLYQECQAVVERLLGNDPVTTANQPVAQPIAPSPQMLRSQTLAALKDHFLQLATEGDRKKAGFALEQLLNQLFQIFELQPRQPFKVIGEQIDGSFLLDSQIYLVEA